MSLFRERSAVVEAVQYDGSNADEIVDWVSDTADGFAYRNEDGLIVGGPTADVVVTSGSWLVRGADGHVYRFPEGVFKERYEAVGES